MGWWEIRKDSGEIYDPSRHPPAEESDLLTVGDEPMDVLESALRRVARIYRRDLRRRPTVEELSRLLESGISVLQDEVLDNMEEREVEAVVVTLRQRPRRPRLKPGDYFGIPLPSGGYGYGRTMKVTHRTLLWAQTAERPHGGLVAR